MRKLLFILLTVSLLLSCKKETKKNYATISGKITNKLSDELYIKNSENQLLKTIKITEDGTFKDTLQVVKGNYSLSDGGEYAKLFLYPDSDLYITLDTKQFDETLTFSGKGSGENNYSKKKLLLLEDIYVNSDGFFDKTKEDFTKDLDSVKLLFNDLLKTQKKLDSLFVQNDIEETKGIFGFLATKYDDIAKIKTLTGKASPIFTNYENHDGTTTSLSDLKGKYIYIDVWATWCRPCLAEIPALKELEKELGDNIYFVSISIDKKDKHSDWKQMVIDKGLKGVQLFADKNWESQFVRDYGINGIPRFILIDPQGNVVNPDTSRPSDSKTKEMLTNLIN